MSEKAKKPARNSARETAPAILVRLMQQLVVVLLAVMGFLFCLLSSYTFDLPTAKLVWTAVAFSLLFLAVFTLPKSGLFALVCFLGGAVYIALNASDLLQGVLLLIERVTTQLELRMPDVMQLLLQPAMADEAALLMTRAMQMILYFVSFFATFFIVSQPSVPGLALATLPLLVPAPFYLLSPARLPFFMLFAAHLMVFAFNNARRAQSTFRAGVYVPQSRRKANQQAQRAAQYSLSLLALPIIAIAALLSGVVLPQKNYERPEAIESLQQKIFSLDIGKDAFWRSNDGLTRGDLKSLSSIRFTGATALKVRVSEQASLYLRDYAGTVFTENGWESVSNSEFSKLAGNIGIAPQNLHTAALEASGTLPDTFSLTVRNVSATALSIWSPPGLLTKAEAITNAGYVQDTALAFASADSSMEYTLEAIPVDMALYSVAHADKGFESAYQKAVGKADTLYNAENDAADAVRDAAETYIGYVFDVYTQLPDSTMAAAQSLLSTYGIQPIYDGNELNLAATCQQVRALLAQQCSYDYSPPEMPEGADFATWFLQDAKRGYCVHFATTGTVLLRALGIPARYAEGYIVIQKDYEKQPDAEGFIDIEDTHAHAWVEVFDPSLLEWVPVEMTKTSTQSSNPSPDASGELSDMTTPSFSTNSPEPTATPTPTPTPTPEPTPEPTLQQDGSTPDPNATPESTDGGAAMITPTPAPSDGGTEDGSATPEGEDATADTGGGAKPPLWPLAALLAAVSLPLGAFGYRKFRHERLLRTFQQKDANAAVLAGTRFALKMLRSAGAPAMQHLESPEQYAYAVARQLPAVDRAQLESALLIAQRATFSGRTCSKKEREEVLAFANALVSTLPARMKGLKRILFLWRFPPIYPF